MSACISRHGGYGEHTPDAEWTCTRCGVVDVPDLLAEVERLREIVAVADRVAASLGLVLHDAHPTFGSTTLWRGGIGGQALTSHCSIVHGAHPGGEWAEFDLPSHYLREWVSLRGDDYDHDEMKATVRADLLALLDPTEGENR